jgi:phosphate starvation-inducible membrane PsiE
MILPKGILYVFCKLESIENIYDMFFEKTITTSKDDNYETYDMKSKLLFYFTFFELLTANRSYVVMNLQQNKTNSKLDAVI